jgi:hypothetical protein
MNIKMLPRDMIGQVYYAPNFVTDELFNPLAEMRWELRPISESIG